MKISRELKNSGISSSSIDTTKSSRDPYIVPFNFISQHRCDWSESKQGHCQWSLYYLFLRAAFVQGLFPVGADFLFNCEFFGRQHLIKDIWYRIKKEKNYWDGGKPKVIHHWQKIMFLQINCFKRCLMHIRTLKIKIVSPGLVLLALRQSIVIIVSSVIIFVAGVITIM